RRNRQKDRNKNSIRTKLRNKHTSQDNSTNQLYAKSEQHNHFDQRPDVLAAVRVDGLLGKLDCLKTQLSSDRDVKKGGNRYKPQPAELNQQQDNHLPQGAEIGISVLYDEPCYAGGRGSGEKGGGEGGKNPFPRGKG